MVKTLSYFRPWIDNNLELNYVVTKNHIWIEFSVKDLKSIGIDFIQVGTIISQLNEVYNNVSFDSIKFVEVGAMLVFSKG